MSGPWTGRHECSSVSRSDIGGVSFGAGGSMDAQPPGHPHEHVIRSAAVEQAAGVLAYRLPMSVDRTVEELVRVARLHRRSVQALAEEVVNASCHAARHPNDLRDVIARHWPALLEPAHGVFDCDEPGVPH